MKKDDIEKLFSSLEDFSKTPPDDLWLGIEEKLDYPKKKRGFAYWAVAASLLIGLGLFATFYFSTKKDALIVPSEIERGVVNQSKSADTIAKESIKDKITPQKTILDNRVTNSDQTNTVKTKGQSETKTQTNKTFINTKISSESKNEALAVVKKQNANNKLSKPQQFEKEVLVQQNRVVEKEQIIAEKEKVNDNKAVSDSKIKEDLTGADLKENALVIIAKEQQKKDKKTVEEEKWSMQLFAGVNNSQNLKKQKTLGNTIESQKGYSYGVKTNYKLNRRWAVSTGLKISELGQQVANVAYVNTAKNLINISKASLAAVPNERGTFFSNPNYLFIPKVQNEKNALASASTFYEKGNLSQRVQYLEMPMEISYAVLNKGKARINMNTGGFIGKAIANEVLLNDSSIGENRDVNDVVFGTSLSSTLQYELYKKTKIFVEPGMNFYTQPVQNQNFNQFQLILNFGLNVSF